MIAAGDTTSGAVDTGDSDDKEGKAEVLTDPVCGMDVSIDEAATTAAHERTTDHVCGPGCPEAFVDVPERFVERVQP